MESLLRTQVSGFCLKDSLTLSRIEELRDIGSLEQHILAVDKVFDDYPSIIMKPEFDKLVHNGNPFNRNQALGQYRLEEGPVRVYDSKEQFIGVYEPGREEDLLKPQKVFLGGN